MSQLRKEPLLLIGLVLLALGSGLIARSESRAAAQPRECRGCHTEAYRLWARSAHNRAAYRGAAFQAAWQLAKEAPQCLACHTTGFEVDGGDFDYPGVACAACHTPVTEEYDPAERDHPRMSSPRRPEDCAACHGADHALTYVEWQASKHNGLRQIACRDCHEPHSGDLPVDNLTAFCEGCHRQPVPVTSPYMHHESGCTDCHPAPISTDNVHMQDSPEAAIDCAACHFVAEPDSQGRFLTSGGHSLEVPLAACVNCHGALHTMQPHAE